MRLLKRSIAIMIMLILLILIQHVDGEPDMHPLPAVVDEPQKTEEELLQEWIMDSINTVVWSYTISEAIVKWCRDLDDRMLCMKHVFWVATAESSLFKNVWKKNNAFWITHRKCNKLNWTDRACRYWIKQYWSVEESIYDFIDHYKRNKRYKRTRWQNWISGKYCTSQCSNRIPAFNSWMKKFESAVE